MIFPWLTPKGGEWGAFRAVRHYIELKAGLPRSHRSTLCLRSDIELQHPQLPTHSGAVLYRPRAHRGLSASTINVTSTSAWGSHAGMPVVHTFGPNSVFRASTRGLRNRCCGFRALASAGLRPKERPDHYIVCIHLSKCVPRKICPSRSSLYPTSALRLSPSSSLHRQASYRLPFSATIVERGCCFCYRVME